VLEDVVQCYVVITASTKLNEWTTMALVNLTFTIISMLFAVLSKIVDKIGGSAEATADDSVENATNPLGPELPDSAAE